MEGFFEVDYDMNAFYEYQKDILRLGLCEVFVPMGFISKSGKEVAIYNINKYLPITAIKNITAKSALYIMLTLIGGIIKAENHYLYFGEYQLDINNICYNQVNFKGAILYSPNKEQERKPGSLDLSKIAYFLLLKIRRGDNNYMKDAFIIIKNSSFGLKVLYEQIKRLYYLSD